MENKKYLVIRHSVCDYEDLGIGTSLFDKVEDAEECFKDLVEDEKDYIEDDWSINSEKWLFEAWEDGDYTRNHSLVEIREMIVE
jgi:hypothetical protein